MSLLPPNVAVPETWDRFRETSRNLFGNIEQRYLGEQTPHGSLATQTLGWCQITRIVATAHAVASEAAAKRASEADTLKAMLQINGRTRFQQDDIDTSLGPGEWLLFYPQRSYTVLNTTEVDQIIVQVPHDEIRARRGARTSAARTFAAGTDGLPRIIRNLVESTSNEMNTLEPAARRQIGESFANLLSLLLDSSADGSELDRAPIALLRQRAKSYIEGRLEDPDLSVDGIAAALHCSRRYVFRAFEGEDETPDRYIWDARLDRCRDWLAAPNRCHLLISQIAFACGFNSTAHFSRAFKARYGTTPREFRQEYVQPEIAPVRAKQNTYLTG
jgi:AraC-like DNA-binding protein